MFGTYEIEMQNKHHSEDLAQQAEDQRNMRQVKKVLDVKKEEQSSRRKVYFEVQFVKTNNKILCEIAVKGE
jgi:hypothetical protein